ncbi:MAG: TetR family transcriptional regulator [Solobacterium sp.]|nr:TetR family transcriptional regulator [Solobacterium sp.]
MKPMDHAYKNLSCQLITEALFRLMEKEDYSDITISEITMEAGVARRTFYLNFSSKEEILDRHYETLIREYDENITAETANDIRKQAEYFFAFWQRHRAYASLLEKNGMLYMLVNRFHLYLDRTGLTFAGGVPSTELVYLSSYIAGGLWMMLQAWLQRGFRETPQQLAAIFASAAGLAGSGREVHAG